MKTEGKENKEKNLGSQPRIRLQYVSILRLRAIVQRAIFVKMDLKHFKIKLK